MIVQASELMNALASTERLVLRLDELGAPIEKITAADAIKIVRNTAHTGVRRGRRGQIRCIRPVSTRKPKPITDAFPGRPVIPIIGYNRTNYRRAA